MKQKFVKEGNDHYLKAGLKKVGRIYKAENNLWMFRYQHANKTVTEIGWFARLSDAKDELIKLHRKEAQNGTN